MLILFRDLCVPDMQGDRAPGQAGPPEHCEDLRVLHLHPRHLHCDGVLERRRAVRKTDHKSQSTERKSDAQDHEGTHERVGLHAQSQHR